jgi:hypothetical protein
MITTVKAIIGLAGTIATVLSVGLCIGIVGTNLGMDALGMFLTSLSFGMAIGITGAMLTLGWIRR